MKALTTILFAITMAAPAIARAETTPMPIVPIASAMQHWDNHCYIWLPEDDVFEVVEVMSLDRGQRIDRSSGPSSPSAPAQNVRSTM